MALVELVRATTSDGLRLDGAFSMAAPANGALAICLHGVGTNFYGTSFSEALVAPLIERGTNVLRVNTRGHDGFFASSTPRRWLGSAFETIDDCRLDVLAWLAWAKARGYERVLLVGHSLGAIKALYTAAHEELPGVSGVIALSPPRLSHEHFCQGPAQSVYLATLAEAQSLASSGRGEELFLSRFPFPMLITSAAYIDKYGPGERYNILRFLPRVPQRTLFTYGSEELPGTSFAGVVEAIDALALPHVRVQTIDGADHLYTRRHAEVAATIAAWLDDS